MFSYFTKYAPPHSQNMDTFVVVMTFAIGMASVLMVPRQAAVRPFMTFLYIPYGLFISCILPFSLACGLGYGCL